MTVRTRFAPSPTGHVHIGNIRAAIYNWLFARHTGGRFLLRVEDTDRERSTPEAVEAVHAALRWLGIEPDEPPMYQSAQLAAHRAAAERLLAAGRAYREDKGGTGKGECIVFRMPGTDMRFHDEIKGELVKPAADLKDFVIVRSDGSPVFHLANVADDIAMGITHVIRGDDHIENTYRHVALFEALGAPVPRYAHLPMIVNAQGKPYSKRDGAAYVGDFRDRGFLADALFNYLALLGWSPGGDRERLSRDEMTALFDFTRVQSSPAQFDVRKLLWMNGEYMRALPLAEREAQHRADLALHGLAPADDAYARRVFGIMGDRIKLFSDTAAQTVFFFTEDYPVDEKAFRKAMTREGAADLLAAVARRLADAPAFAAADLEALVRACGEERGVKIGLIVQPLRAAVSGTDVGPGLFEMLETLGRERVARRIARSLERARALPPPASAAGGPPP